MHKLTGVFAVIIMCFAAAQVAVAEPIYYYAFDSANLVSGDPQAGTANYQYTATPVYAESGEVAYYTCTVNVYLYEYSAGTGETYIAPTPPNAAEGLQSAGVVLTQTGGETSYTVAVDGGNPAFSDFNSYLSPSNELTTNQVAGVQSFQDVYATTGVTGAAIDAETTAMLVGTFTFTMPADADFDSANPLTFVTDGFFDSMVANESFITQTSIDDLIVGNPTLTVVPEPPSVVALSGLAAMGALMWVVRRARRFRPA